MNTCLPQDYNKVLGWLTFEEALTLQGLTCSASGLPGDIVELGSYCGRSAIAIAIALAQGCCGHLHCVDPHTDTLELYGVDSLQQLTENIDRYKLHDYITLHIDTSARVSQLFKPETVKVLFIDACHDYESVKEDFELWQDKVVRRGFLAFHDSQEEGPAQVIQEIVERCYDTWQAVLQKGSLTLFRKIA